MADTLSRLEATIARRREAPPSSSYVAKLHARGIGKIAQKTGEEAVETVIAALSEDREALIGEAADLIFHLLVLLGARGITLAEVLAELDRREGVSGLAEKAARAEPEPVPEPVPAPPSPEPIAHPIPLAMRDAAEPALALGKPVEQTRRPRIRKG